MKLAFVILVCCCMSQSSYDAAHLRFEFRGLIPEPRLDFGSVTDAARVDTYIVCASSVGDPGGTPLMGIFPVSASPACLAEEAAGVATPMSSMRRTPAEVLDTMILQDFSPASPSVERRRSRLTSMPLNSDLVQQQRSLADE